MDGSRFEALALLKDLEEHENGLEPDLFSYVSRDGTAKNASAGPNSMILGPFCVKTCLKFDLQQMEDNEVRRLFGNKNRVILEAPNGCDSICEYVKFDLRSGPPSKRRFILPCMQ